MEISRNQQGWPTAFTSCISVLQVLTLLFDLLSCTILGDPGAVRNLFRPCLITFVATTVPGFPKMDRSQQSLWFSLQNIPLKTTIPLSLPASSSDATAVPISIRKLLFLKWLMFTNSTSWFSSFLVILTLRKKKFISSIRWNWNKSSKRLECHWIT